MAISYVVLKLSRIFERGGRICPPSGARVKCVATDRCYAVEAESPVGPCGGPAGQRDRVAPGSRSGLGRAGAPRPVIGRWCPAPRGTGEVTWGRLAMRRGQSGGQSGFGWWCIWCGAEIHFGRWRRSNIFQDEVKWCEGDVTEVT